jgi:tRNA-dihydrouridine synthase 3
VSARDEMEASSYSMHRPMTICCLYLLQRLHWRAPAYVGRSQLETLLASESAGDWVRISEMLLGPVPANFSFAPKHKANAYANSEGGMAFEAQAEG